MDYCGEFMYEDNELVCIFAPFGRMRPMKTDQGTQWRAYYSLTDHLGNVRAEFAAHDSGQPELVQQADYYPFGYTLRREDYGSQLPNRRLFGGKELQDETLAGNALDWYDFEARMYDPLIGRFMTTDPLAEKYYSLTPYGYCGNNPMNAYDLHGDSISITYNTRFFSWGHINPGNSNSVIYYDGVLYNKDGNVFTENNEFLKQCMNAISEIRKSSIGDKMVSTLQSSSNMFTIMYGDDDYTPLKVDRNKAYASQIKSDPQYSALLEASDNLEGGAGGIITWSYYGAKIPTTEGILINSRMDLAHELSHALDSDRGLLDNREEQGVPRLEWRAVRNENLIRGQLGLPLRTHYQIKTNSKGECIGGAGPKMLTDDNQPLPLSW